MPEWDLLLFSELDPRYECCFDVMLLQEYKPPVSAVFGGDSKLDVRINCISPGAVNTPLLRNTGKECLFNFLSRHTCMQ